MLLMTYHSMVIITITIITSLLIIVIIIAIIYKISINSIITFIVMIS